MSSDDDVAAKEKSFYSIQVYENVAAFSHSGHFDCPVYVYIYRDVNQTDIYRFKNNLLRNLKKYELIQS